MKRAYLANLVAISCFTSFALFGNQDVSTPMYYEQDNFVPIESETDSESQQDVEEQSGEDQSLAEEATPEHQPGDLQAVEEQNDDQQAFEEGSKAELVIDEPQIETQQEQEKKSWFTATTFYVMSALLFVVGFAATKAHEGKRTTSS